ncbi:MAG: PAS domain S-box protein [Chloroflexi bacterium]|nr:PAS domain S-box protein [Chloroflexota bacterium]
MVQGMTADILLSIIAAVSFAAALYVAIARRDKPTWKAGAVLLLACAELTLARALQDISPDFATRVFWYKMCMLGFTITPTAFLCLALRYSGLAHVLTLRTRLLLSIFPALTAGLISTNEIHGWTWNPASTARIVNSMSFPPVADARIGYWFLVAYSYFVLGLGCFFLIRLLVRSRGIYDWQIGAVVIAAIAASLGSALDIFKMSPLEPFAATALGLVVSSITIVFALSPLRRRDILAVTRGATISSISDSIIVVDGDNRIVDMNPAAERLAGTSASQAIGRHLDQLLAELKANRACLANESGEVTLRRENTSLHFDLRVSPVRDWRGRLVGQVIALRDITERKQAEEALHESEERFRSILDNIEDGYYEVDTAGNFTFVNPALVRMLGRPANELLGMNNRLYMTPAGGKVVFQTFNRVFRTGIPEQAFDWDLVRPDGTLRSVEVSVSLIKAADGSINGFRGTVRDITERKRAAEEICHLASFPQFTPVLIIEFNLKTEALFINPAMQSAIKHLSINDPRQFIPLDWQQELSTPDNIQKETDIQETLVAGRIFEEQIQFNPEFKSLRIYATDITERKRAEEALRASLAEKEVLLKEVHHRVKNNLASIIGLLGLQRETVADPAAVARFRELEGRIRAMALVHETLYHTESLARIDLQHYLETLIAQLRAALAPYGDVRFSVAAAGVEMGLDTAVPCGLILNELITNALKYAFPGGQPRPGEQACEITVSAEWDGGVYTLTVADNGVGLPADLDWATTKTLGLRLVRLLADHQLGGNIEIDRAGGTRLVLQFGSTHRR